MNDRLAKLKNIFGKVTEVEATFRANAVVTDLGDTTLVYLFKYPKQITKPGFSVIKEVKEIKKLKKKAKENDLPIKKSTRRCRRLIALNTFDLFVTFTFKTDRYDIQKCRRRMETWLENQKKSTRNGKFEYVVVMEFHKDGAVHFHALFKGYKGKLVKAINQNTGELIIKKGRQAYNIPSYTHGLVEAYKCGKDEADKARLKYYLNKLEKYLTKEMVSLGGKKRFWSSRGLERPAKQYDPPWLDLSVKPIWENDGEWGVTKIFSKEQIADMKKRMDG